MCLSASHSVASCDIFEVDLIESRQIKEAHEPLARVQVLPRWIVAQTTHRHHMMLVGHYPLNRVLIRHTHAENFSKRLQAMHLYSLS